jgi:hypothetical protein
VGRKEAGERREEGEEEARGVSGGRKGGMGEGEYTFLVIRICPALV